MNGFIGIVVSTLIALGCAALVFCCAPNSITSPMPVVPVRQESGFYQDACVYREIHPQLELSIEGVADSGPSCPLCHYVLEITNKTGYEGTKAYEVRAWLVKNEPSFVLDGQTIPTLKLHGFISDLKPISLGTVRNSARFALQAMCPECLGQERFITVLIEYKDCTGTHLYQARCDLGSLQGAITRQSHQPGGGCD